MRPELESSRAEARGIDPDDPPLVWEASGGRWRVVTGDGRRRDETGGFLLGGGAITVEMPAAGRGSDVGGTSCIGCDAASPPRGVAARAATRRAPEITAVTAAVVGATVGARHAATVDEELIGTSDGIAGRHLPRCSTARCCALEEGETLEVREPGADAGSRGSSVDSFAKALGTTGTSCSTRTGGEVRFGPAIRQPDGGWRATAPSRRPARVLRFTRYRHGGGQRRQHRAARRSSILPAPIAGIAGVTNPRPAAAASTPNRWRARASGRA